MAARDIRAVTSPHPLPVGLDDIRAAHGGIEGLVHRTPCASSATLSRMTGLRITLKLENLQKTGSFKPRGALTVMKRLAPEERARGVITISAGNHAQGVAYAASVLGCPAVVVMPAGASPAKAEAARGYGAEVVLHGDVAAAFEKMHALRHERGLAFVHPFDDPGTVAGQGTLGLEVLEDVPDADVVVAGIGGGGLASGIAVAVKALRPAARVVGVEPVGAAAMRRSLDEGRPARLDRIDTIADGLAPPFVGDLNFEILRRLADDVVLVTDDEIRSAMRFLLERCKTLAEPAGAAAVAAVLAGMVKAPPGSRVVCVVSGGNVSPDALAAHLAAAPRI
jgi:threonine dehydratase